MTVTSTRRTFVGGIIGLGGIAVLPGCQTVPGFSLTDAIRELLTISSQSACARLMQPHGFFDSQISRIPLPAVFGQGNLSGSLLDLTGLRGQFQKVLNNVAEDGAERAAPVVAQAIRSMTIADATSIIRGGPTAATDYLRGSMGMTLLDLMVPEIGSSLRFLNNEIVTSFINAATGYDVNDLARDLSSSAENAIWRSIGAEEA